MYKYGLNIPLFRMLPGTSLWLDTYGISRKRDKKILRVIKMVPNTRHSNPIGEHPDMTMSEDFLNMEDPPAAKEMEFEWERPASVEQQRNEQLPDEEESPQRRIRARRGAPDFNRRPSFEYEDYKKNAYNRLSIFDNRR